MPVKAKGKTLTRTQRVEIFCMAILKGETQADAYRLAYPNSKKWKPDSVYCNASQFTKDAKVVQRLRELQKGQLKNHHATVDDILTELSYTVKFNPLDFFNEDGSKKPFHELPVSAMKAVSITETEDAVTWYFRQSDKNKAALMLGNFHQMWESNIVHPDTQGSGTTIHAENVNILSMPLEKATKMFKEYMNAD